ncbi:serine/threonine protein kinase [Nanoarchaeota archaeon]
MPDELTNIPGLVQGMPGKPYGPPQLPDDLENMTPDQLEDHTRANVAWLRQNSLGLEPDLENRTEPAYAGFLGELDPNRFELLGKYAKGGRSIIFAARDLETGGEVAVKKHLLYMPDDSDDIDAMRTAEERFQRESEILGRMDHPGIIDAFGFYFRTEEGEKMPYLVMPLLRQNSIADELERGIVYTEEEAVNALMWIIPVLDYVHGHSMNGRPIIYKDLKPNNVLLMPDDAEWAIKMVDFAESGMTNYSRTGSVAGTIGYNAPELFGKQLATKSVDFYSALKIVARMLTPDEYKFSQTWFNAIPLRESGIYASEKLLTVIERGTSDNIEERYHTARDLASDLGYQIEEMPETREGLEAILSKETMPVAVGSARNGEITNSMLMRFANTDFHDIGYIIGLDIFIPKRFREIAKHKHPDIFSRQHDHPLSRVAISGIGMGITSGFLYSAIIAATTPLDFPLPLELTPIISGLMTANIVMSFKDPLGMGPVTEGVNKIYEGIGNAGRAIGNRVINTWHRIAPTEEQLREELSASQVEYEETQERISTYDKGAEERLREISRAELSNDELAFTRLFEESFANRADTEKSDELEPKIRKLHERIRSPQQLKRDWFKQLWKP